MVLHLPWVQGLNILKTFQFSFGGEKSQEEVHPATGVTDRYSVCDHFHEKNLSSAPDILRRVMLVPELKTVINTEVEEQLHNNINRSNYTFHMMLPGNHLFMMRHKIHLSNTHIDIAQPVKQGNSPKVNFVFEIRRFQGDPCKCPQARESEVELIYFVMFFFVTQVP